MTSPEPWLAASVTDAGWLLLVLAAIGTLYITAAAVVFRRFFARDVVDRTEVAPRKDAVTLLKPLCGSEPALLHNLASFVDQRHDGPMQIVCGVTDLRDQAVPAVNVLRRQSSGVDIELVVSASRHGESGKVSNLVNMARHAAHPVIVLSDSDIVARPDYLARVLDALDAPGVGAVSLLYHGRGDRGLWSTLGAAGLSYQFLPGAVFGVALGIATPCMGSTIALSSHTLARIGGFVPFADVLADDYAIGAAVRDLGLEVVVPPYLVAHASAERSFVELWRHEVRWAATVRSVVPAAYCGSLVGMPLPLALLGLALTCNVAWGGAILCAALVARLLMIRAVDREVGARTASPWLLPLRDCLSLAVFAASFFARKVDWRGARLKVMRHGRLVPDTEHV